MDVILDQILDEDVVPLIGLGMRNAHQPRQHARDGDDGMEDFVRALGPLQAQEKIVALVLQLREGMARVDGQRRQHRENLVAEIMRGPRLVLLAQRLEIVEVNAVLAQRGQQLVVPELVLVLDHLQDFLPDRIEGLARAHAVGTGVVRLVLDLLLDAGHAHLEEFVQVGGDDAEEADALQQRLARVLRFFQHAAVEGQPAQLAVDEELGIGEVGRGHGGRGRYSLAAGSGNARIVTSMWRRFGQAADFALQDLIAPHQPRPGLQDVIGGNFDQAPGTHGGNFVPPGARGDVPHLHRFAAPGSENNFGLRARRLPPAPRFASADFFSRRNSAKISVPPARSINSETQPIPVISGSGHSSK